MVVAHISPNMCLYFFRSCTRVHGTKKLDYFFKNKLNFLWQIKSYFQNSFVSIQRATNILKKCRSFVNSKMNHFFNVRFVFSVFKRFVKSIIERSADDVCNKSIWSFYLCWICLRIVWKICKVIPASLVAHYWISIGGIKNKIAGETFNCVIPDF